QSRTTAAQFEARLVTVARDDNERAVELLKKQGVKFIAPEPAAARELEAAMRRARQVLGKRLLGSIHLEDIEAQLEARRAHAAGLAPPDVLQVRIYVTDKKEYLARTREVGEAWRRHMGRHYPAMTLVEVSALLEEAAKVEIEALAVRT